MSGVHPQRADFSNGVAASLLPICRCCSCRLRFTSWSWPGGRSGCTSTAFIGPPWQGRFQIGLRPTALHGRTVAKTCRWKLQSAPYSEHTHWQGTICDRVSVQSGLFLAPAMPASLIEPQLSDTALLFAPHAIFGFRMGCSQGCRGRLRWRGVGFGRAQVVFRCVRTRACCARSPAEQAVPRVVPPSVDGRSGRVWSTPRSASQSSPPLASAGLQRRHLQPRLNTVIPGEFVRIRVLSREI